MVKNKLILIQTRKYFLFFITALLIGTVILSALKTPVIQQKKWEAPKGADTLKNPFCNNTVAAAKGKILFDKTCAICHGAKGKGDGVAGVSLNPRPQDLSSSLVQKQTDGAIYWKITTGRPPMASYKSTLTKEQQWQLVNYIRQLKSETK